MCAYSVFNTFPVYPLSAKPLILLAFCRYRYHTSLFNRPGFQEMIEDIEAGYVTTVIVKDTMLHELVERIDVYHIQGTGKNRTQRLVIHYKFVGVLDLPHSPVLPGNVVLNSRQGVEIEYLVGKAG